MVDLQRCVSFRCRAKGFSYTYSYIYSFHFYPSRYEKCTDAYVLFFNLASCALYFPYCY